MGVLLILISALGFASSTYFGKIVTNTTNMTGIVTSFSRFVLGTIVMGLYILITKKSFKAPDIKPIAQRSFYNSISIIIFSAAFSYTTVTKITMLHMTYPVFVMIFAPYYTKEVVDKKNFIYLFIIMLGSYIVVNPGLGRVNVGDLMGLASAAIGSFSLLSLTRASKKNESYIIVFYVMLIGIGINLPFALRDLMNFEMAGAFPVFMAALLGVLGQIFVTAGYRYVDSATGALIASSRTIMGALIGAIFLGEIITFRILMGMILITGSLIGVSGFFGRKHKDKDQDEDEDKDPGIYLE